MSYADEAEALLGTAWGLITNAHSGDWSLAAPEWRTAAEKWRDDYGALIGARNEVDPDGVLDFNTDPSDDDAEDAARLTELMAMDPSLTIQRVTAGEVQRIVSAAVTDAYRQIQVDG